MMEHISLLTVADIDVVLSKRRQTESSVLLSDNELALALFAEEAEGLLNITKGRISASNYDNESFADELFNMEQMAHYDHLMAIALSEGRAPPPRPRLRDRARRRRTSTRCVLTGVRYFCRVSIQLTSS